MCVAPEVVKGVDEFVKHKELAGIKYGNDYVLASSGDRPIRGGDTLQAVTKEVDGLQKPKLITPTRTRKNVPTPLQLLDMNNTELTWVTNHMGHTKDTHFAWYRKENSTIELTKNGQGFEGYGR